MDHPYEPPKAELETVEEQNVNVSKGIRFLSLCMIIGSIVALLTMVILSGQIFVNPFAAIVIVPFAFLFSIYIWKGISLWKGSLQSYKWAFWLFAIQIPIIAFPGFSYNLFTGILIALQVGDVTNNIVLNVGGGFNFLISPEMQGYFFGVNIFALIASIYIARETLGKDNLREHEVVNDAEPPQQC